MYNNIVGRLQLFKLCRHSSWPDGVIRSTFRNYYCEILENQGILEHMVVYVIHMFSQNKIQSVGPIKIVWIEINLEHVIIYYSSYNLTIIKDQSLENQSIKMIL